MAGVQAKEGKPSNIGWDHGRLVPAWLGLHQAERRKTAGRPLDVLLCPRGTMTEGQPSCDQCKTHAQRCCSSWVFRPASRGAGAPSPFNDSAFLSRYADVNRSGLKVTVEPKRATQVTFDLE